MNRKRRTWALEEKAKHERSFILNILISCLDKRGHYRPSYEDCNEPLAYCLVGTSECIKNERGCLCGGCPVFAIKGFDRGYFCLR